LKYDVSAAFDEAAGVVGVALLPRVPLLPLLETLTMMITATMPSSQNRFFLYQGLRAFALAFDAFTSALALFASPEPCGVDSRDANAGSGFGFVASRD
jgi:hypothetical protein